MIGLVGLESAGRSCADLDWACWEYLLARLGRRNAGEVRGLYSRACPRPGTLWLAFTRILCSPLQDEGIYSGALTCLWDKTYGHTTKFRKQENISVQSLKKKSNKKTQDEKIIQTSIPLSFLFLFGQAINGSMENTVSDLVFI